MPKYNCLTSEEIEIARLPSTTEEEASREFNFSIPRGPRRGLHNRAADRFIHQEMAQVFVYSGGGAPRSKLVRSLFSWHKLRAGMLAWEFSQRTTKHYSMYRFLHLYRLIRQLKPLQVVEFGAGVSTVLIAEILRANHLQWGVKGRLVSYEQSPQYYEKYLANFPSELAEYATIELKSLTLEWFGQYRGIYYAIDEFPQKVDFVYIDGATRTRGCSECDFVYRRLNADIVRMKNMGVEIGMAITDHRHANYPFYLNELSSRYRVRLSKLWRSIIVTPK